MQTTRVYFKPLTFWISLVYTAITITTNTIHGHYREGSGAMSGTYSRRFPGEIRRIQEFRTGRNGIQNPGQVGRSVVWGEARRMMMIKAHIVAIKTTLLKCATNRSRYSTSTIHHQHHPPNERHIQTLPFQFHPHLNTSHQPTNHRANKRFAGGGSYFTVWYHRCCCTESPPQFCTWTTQFCVSGSMLCCCWHNIQR